jgi:hypothetical protein
MATCSIKREGIYTSEYAKIATKFKDLECLLAALKEVGYDNVEVHEKAERLVDFQGRQTHYTDATGDTANVIVRRKYVGGAANDLGFLKSADGSYAALVSQYDSHRHNEQWFGKLKAKYAEKFVAKEAKRQGMKLYSPAKSVNGKRVIQYLDMRA